MNNVPFNRRKLEVGSEMSSMLSFRIFDVIDFFDQDIKISSRQNIKIKNFSPPTSRIQEKISAGFTLIELLIVMALMGILVSFVIVNVSGAQRSTSVITSEDSFISDMKLQQAKAMNTYSSPSGVIADYGVYIQPTKYVLFQGTTYNPANAENITIDIDTNLQLTTTFPSSTVVFSRMTGEIVNYGDGSNTISIRNTVGNETRTISLNRLGVVVGN
jgi:prepilin-type N-terminal cleavage/methylation domain-containing protein